MITGYKSNFISGPKGSRAVKIGISNIDTSASPVFMAGVSLSSAMVAAQTANYIGKLPHGIAG